MYEHTILEPKTLYFKPEYHKCHKCGKKLEKHIVCEGARWHVLSWDTNGVHCSAPNCEKNHRCQRTPLDIKECD